MTDFKMEWRGDELFTELYHGGYGSGEMIRIGRLESTFWEGVPFLFRFTTDSKIREVQAALDDFVRRGYLKRTPKGYVDSDRVKKLLKAGKSRVEIARILDSEAR